MVYKSIVLTGAEPRAETDISFFQRTARQFYEKGYRVFEYCSETDQLKEKAECIRALGGESIFLLAIYQKRSGKCLGDPCEENRRAAVAELEELIQKAWKAGIRKFLLTSGPKVELAKTLLAYCQLIKSLQYLLDKTSGDVSFLLEPGDTDVEFCQLVGPTDIAVDIVKQINDSRMKLVMDTSHIRQLGENVLDAFEKAKPWCSHIHLANCVLRRGDPMYGDKHPLFRHKRWRVWERRYARNSGRDQKKIL